MLLAIDAGNTNIVFAIFDGVRLCGEWRASTDAKRTADEYAVWLTQLMGLELLTPQQIDACILSSVVPDVVFALTSLSRRYFHVEPRLVNETSLDLGLKVRIPNPKEVGADRLVNAVAALALHQPPLVIIDFGTATTFDVVDADGNYAGGVIAPGVNLSLDALSNAAAKLPRVPIRKTDRVIGDSTVSAMQSGIFWGYVGLVEGLTERLKREIGGDRPITILATGGLAPMIAAATSCIDSVESDLTLTGLRLIHERNPA